MKKILFIASIISIFNFDFVNAAWLRKSKLICFLLIFCCSQFSISRAQQPDAVYKLLRYEWTLNADGSSDYHYRHEIQILRNCALTAYADKGETFIVYNPELEDVTINEVYTRQLDGTRIEMPQNAFVYQLPEECADCGRFNHLRELAMVHTGMELGCVIVVDYTIHRQYNLLYEDIPLKRECPIEKLEVKVNYPQDIDMKWDLLGKEYLPEGGFTRTTSINTDNNTKGLAFSIVNMPQTPYEPYMPANIVPTLRLYNSTPEHTPAFDQKPFNGASNAVAQQITGTDELKNVAAIRNFVVDNIHLNDIHPSHLGYIHSTPEVTWQTGCGTAIDKAVLLTAILINEGYRARIIGNNKDEVGVFIDTIEYRLDIRHKTPLEINGEAHDEVEKFDFSGEGTAQVDTLEDGYLRLSFGDIPYPLSLPAAANLTSVRTTPLVTTACDINVEQTFPIGKGVKLLGGDINRSVSYRGIGSVEISVKQNGDSLKVIRRIKIEKTLIPVADYAKYRQLIATWQSVENVMLYSGK